MPCIIGQPCRPASPPPSSAPPCRPIGPACAYWASGSSADRAMTGMAIAAVAASVMASSVVLTAKLRPILLIHEPPETTKSSRLAPSIGYAAAPKTIPARDARAEPKKAHQIADRRPIGRDVGVGRIGDRVGQMVAAPRRER